MNSQIKEELTVKQMLTIRHLSTDLTNHLLFNFPTEWNSITEEERKEIIRASFAHFKDTKVLPTFEAMLIKMAAGHKEIREENLPVNRNE